MTGWPTETRAEVALRKIDHRPDHRGVRDPEQHVAGLRAHAFDGRALEHDAVARRRPFDRDRNGAAFFHGGDHGVGHVEVLEPLPRTAAIGDAAAGGLRIDGGDVFGRRRGDQRAVDFHQGLALGHSRARGHVGDFLNPAFRSHGDDGDPPFVELNGAGRPDRGANDPRRCGLRLDAGPLDLSRRQFYRAVVGVVALIDRDVIHPHRILLRDRRGVGQPHRVAVEFYLAVCRDRGRGRGGRLVFEAEIGARRHGAVVASIRRLLRGVSE